MSDKLYNWSYSEEVTLEDFIKKVTPLVSNPVQNLMEMEGDMYLSDYRDLQEAANRLLNLLKQLEKEEAND